MVPPSKIVTIYFNHSDARINFFSASFIFDRLISIKMLKHYIYESSGIDHNQVYQYNHKVKVYEQDEQTVIDALKLDGWNILFD